MREARLKTAEQRKQRGYGPGGDKFSSGTEERKCWDCRLQGHLTGAKECKRQSQGLLRPKAKPKAKAKGRFPPARSNQSRIVEHETCLTERQWPESIELERLVPEAIEVRTTAHQASCTECAVVADALCSCGLPLCRVCQSYVGCRCCKEATIGRASIPDYVVYQGEWSTLGWRIDP